MAFGHKQDGTVRAYLLGTLNPERMSEVETAYFLDPEFLKRMHEVEERLILSYLADRLPANEKGLFERRYLALAPLRARVEELRARSQYRAPSRFTMPRLVFAGVSAALLLAAMAAYFSPSVRQRVVQPEIARRATHASYAVLLAPGVVKGTAAPVTVPAPASGESLRLMLERPGEKDLLRFGVRVRRLENDGSMPLIWSADSVTSEKTSGTVAVPATIAAKALAPGDYVAEVYLPSGELRDRYLLRLTPPK